MVDRELRNGLIALVAVTALAVAAVAKLKQATCPHLHGPPAAEARE